MFRTEISIPASTITIDHRSQIMTIGSCFSDRMGQYLLDHKFRALANPFGVVFNPVSIFQLLENAIDLKPPDPTGYVQSDGLFKHLDFHSDFNGHNVLEVEQSIVSVVEKVHSFLKDADVLIITLGTAIVYEYLKTSQIVANCHKIPQKEFKKSRVSSTSIYEAFQKLYQSLSSFNDGLQIIYTVSPVRHIKDTLIENGSSKSILRCSCDVLTESFDQVSYFPSYEIMLDDLRDYRFYKEDMLHPNITAERYIWNKFAETYFTEKSLSSIKEWQKLRKAIDHKPFNPKSDLHQKFVAETITKVDQFSDRFDVSEEMNSLKQQLR
ncbi:MAG: GSCFA domain-containing protein [Bacteroidota bacterium]